MTDLIDIKEWAPKLQKSKSQLDRKNSKFSRISEINDESEAED